MRRDLVLTLLIDAAVYSVNCIILSCLVCRASAQSQDDRSVMDCLRQHAEHLSRIKQYYLKITVELTENEEVLGTPLQKSKVFEVWHAGDRRRVVRHLYGNPTSDGSPGDLDNGGALEAGVMETNHDSASSEKHAPSSPVITDSSIDGDRAYIMVGWDEEHPFELPLEFGRNGREFTSVRCSISPHDPTLLVTDEESCLLLWHVRFHWPLSRIAKESILTLLPRETDGLLRLRIASTTSPELSKLPKGSIGTPGTVFSIDRNKNWTITKIEVPFDDKTVVTEVMDSVETGGIVLPTRIETRVGNDLVSRFTVNEWSINKPIPEEKLQTKFPPGAQVVELPQRVHHLWGDGEPEVTFSTYEELMKHVYARAREYQQGQELRRDPKQVEGSNLRLFLVINGSLISLLILLTILRRKLTRRDGKQKESAS